MENLDLAPMDYFSQLVKHYIPTQALLTVIILVDKIYTQII